MGFQARHHIAIFVGDRVLEVGNNSDSGGGPTSAYACGLEFHGIGIDFSWRD
jgi:hypothetical protein